MDFTKSNPPTKFKDVDAISKEDAQKEVEALRKGVEHHDYLYYVKNQPKISDATYDKLFRRLEELEEAFPELQSENSPTRRVGAPPLESLEKIDHAASMLSLQAALEESEVERFIEHVQKAASGKPEFILEPKFDGVSVEVVYEKGEFQYGATRGDGNTGEGISENLRTIGALPLRLRGEAPDFLSVRGEVYIGKEPFQQMNRQRVEQGKDTYANPRNAAAGVLRRLESKIVAQWPLDVFFYDILKVEGAEFSSHHEVLNRFEDWGLKTDKHVERTSSLSKIKSFHSRLLEERDALPYEIDGIVIKADDLELCEKLGTRHRNPRWALAWKFEPREEVTTLRDIVVQVGRTGMLTPVALLEPVDVGGVTVSRATLHNEGEVHRKDVRVGDRVRIARAGDVIPEVVERVKQPGQKRGQEFSMPERCPACGAEVVREKAYVFCPAGLACRPQLVGRVLHYASRAAMDIDGLGEKTAEELVDREMVQDLADLYRLDKDDLQQLEGFAEKSAQQLYDAIQNAKEARLDRFLYALGIRHVGQRTARQLAMAFGALDALRRAGRERLQQTADIGPEIAASVHEFFHDEANRRTLDRLLESGVTVKNMPQEAKAQPLAGKSFVFTGALANFSRDQAQERVERLGGRATSSVSSNTDYVVVGEDPGSKLNDAREHHVQILDEKRFQALLNENAT